MAYQFISPRLGAQAIADVSTTQKHHLGERVQAVDPDYGVGEFIYCKGVSSGAATDWVTINSDDWTVTRLAANARGPVGILMSAIDAATDYGWVQIWGKAIGKCLTLFADDGRVYATGTTATIDDASVAGDVVYNAKGASTTTVSSGVADFEIHYPFMADRVSIIS